MTGKEAIRLVATTPLHHVATWRRTTDDATLRRVAGWRLDSPAAFDELAEAIGLYAMPPSPQTKPSMPAAPTHAHVVSTHFQEWNTLTDVARVLGRPNVWVSKTLRRAVRESKGRWRLIRRSGPHGIEWKIIEETEHSDGDHQEKYKDPDPETQLPISASTLANWP